MARSTKNARHIKVGDVEYRWRATGDSGFISITIWPDSDIGPDLRCNVGYYETWQPCVEDGRITSHRSLGDQIVITNRIVRRVIDYAISEHGYDPLIRGHQLNLQCVDDKIDLSDAVRAGSRSRS